jgi:enoyl-CoA hydratase/carnithine racemase
MEYQQIQIEQTESIAWITLYRPDKLNALTPMMINEWCKALEALSKQPDCKVIIVKGAGGAFSAGVDLSVFQKSDVAPGYSMHEDGMHLINLLETVPQVCIALVHGFCFTGALEILMAFDLILAAEDAKIGDTHSKWGILPKWGMTQRLARHVGLLKAKELSFMARAVSGKEAAEIGLANLALPLEQLDEKAKQVAAKICENSAQTIAAMKQMYNYGHRYGLNKGIQYELGYEKQISDKDETLKQFKKNF